MAKTQKRKKSFINKQRRPLIILAILLLVGGGLLLSLKYYSDRSEAESRKKLFSVHIVAGQSNAVGWGSDPKSIPKDTSNEKVKFYYNHETSSGGKIVTLKNQRIPFSKHRSGFGPEIRLGRQLYRKGYNNTYIIKVGKGGTSLYKDWKPTNGRLYKSLIVNEINKGLRDLRRQGYRYSIDGFYWMQGESDMNAQGASNYEKNLRNFIASVRRQLKEPNLPVVIGRANNPAAPAKYRNMVRGAQVRVANSTRYVEWVNTDDIKLSDHVHYNSRGQLILGQRFYNKINPYMQKQYPRGLK